MNIISTTIGIKKVFICPRTNYIVLCKVLDEAEFKEHTFDIEDITIKEYYTEFSFNQDILFTEGKFYMLYLYDIEGNVVMREKLYCTDHPVVSYSVNEGQYKTLNGNNEFIIL